MDIANHIRKKKARREERRKKRQARLKADRHGGEIIDTTEQSSPYSETAKLPTMKHQEKSLKRKVVDGIKEEPSQTPTHFETEPKHKHKTVPAEVHDEAAKNCEKKKMKKRRKKDNELVGIKVECTPSSSILVAEHAYVPDPVYEYQQTSNKKVAHRSDLERKRLKRSDSVDTGSSVLEIARKAAALAPTWQATPECWPDPFVHELRERLQCQVGCHLAIDSAEGNKEVHRELHERARANAILVVRAARDVVLTRKSLHSRYDNLFTPMTEELKAAYALDLAIRAFLQESNHKNDTGLIDTAAGFALLFIPRLSSGILKHVPVLNETDPDYPMLQGLLVATLGAASPSSAKRSPPSAKKVQKFM